jgi:hypothetical protein
MRAKKRAVMKIIGSFFEKFNCIAVLWKSGKNIKSGDSRRREDFVGTNLPKL